LKDITAYGMIMNRNRKADSQNGADSSKHPKVRHDGSGTMLYDTRKKLVRTLSLRRMITDKPS